MKTPDHTTAQVFPEYIGGEVIADSASLKWSGLFLRRYRFPRVVDGFLVPATVEPLISAIIAGSAEFENALYVRGYNGQKSRWYRAAVRQKAGQIIAAGMTKKVIFERVDGPINERIDHAYRAKYHDSPYLSPMVSGRARSATVRVMPRSG